MQIIENERIGERLYYKQIDSGLSIYFMPKEGYRRKSAIFATNFGSINNSFIPIGESESITIPQGVAHFLEHKLFEEPDINIFDQFSKLGAYVNAYTDSNKTAYLFSTTSNFYKSLELLIQFVQNPYFTDENVEKEKGIISQEIRMYEDDPNWRVYSNCLEGMYFNHPIKIDIAGTLDSIKDINKGVLYKCYNSFYHPSNMVLFLIGDLSFDKIINTVEKVQKKADKTKEQNIESIYSDEPTDIKNKHMEQKLATSIPLFAIGFKDISLQIYGEELIKKDLVTNILLEILFGNSSEFFNELYNKGLIDNNFSSYFTGKSNFGHSLIIGQSTNPNRVYDEVIKYIGNVKKTKLSEESFNRIKRKNIGGFLMGLNSLDFIANYFVDNYFEEFLFTNVLDIIDSITIDDINDRLTDHLQEEKIVLSIINPY